MIRVLPHTLFNVNKALRIGSIKCLQGLQYQRLSYVNSTGEEEVGQSLRTLASALKHEDKEERGEKAGEKTEEREGANFEETGAQTHPSSAKQTARSSRSPLVWRYRHLLKVGKDAEGLPSKVECFCLACRGNTKHITSSDYVVIDDQPRWTNTTPPRYVERSRRCGNCGVAKRFLPINADIPSFSINQMREFLKDHSVRSHHDQLRALQQALPASREYRPRAPWGQKRDSYEIKSYKVDEEDRALIPKYLEIREGETVRTICTSCGREELDTAPRWLRGTEVYYARAARTCPPGTCKTAVKNMVPVDKKLRYTRHRYLIEWAKKDMAQSRQDIQSK